MNIWTKRPSEAYAQAMEFSGRLPAGSALTSGDAVAINRATGADATSVVLDLPVVISGTQAIIKGKAGESPSDYLITLTVTLDDGSVLVEEILLQVRLAMTLVATAGAIDANSYCTRSQGDAYHQTHLYNTSWLEADDYKKEMALIWATRLLDELVEWQGWKATQEQALRWPRSGVLDRDSYYTLVLGSLPAFLTRATAELARHLLEGDRTQERSFGLQSVRADAVDVVFDKHDVKPILPPSVQSMIAQYGLVMVTNSGMAKLVRV